MVFVPKASELLQDTRLLITEEIYSAFDDLTLQEQRRGTKHNPGDIYQAFSPTLAPPSSPDTLQRRSKAIPCPRTRGIGILQAKFTYGVVKPIRHFLAGRYQLSQILFLTRTLR